MKTKTKTRILSIVEGAVMVALTIVLDMLPLPEWPQGGGISVAVVPLLFYAYRRGTSWGLMAGLVFYAHRENIQRLRNGVEPSFGSKKK